MAVPITPGVPRWTWIYNPPVFPYSVEGWTWMSNPSTPWGDLNFSARCPVGGLRRHQRQLGRLEEFLDPHIVFDPNPSQDRRTSYLAIRQELPADQGGANRYMFYRIDMELKQASYLFTWTPSTDLTKRCIVLALAFNPSDDRLYWLGSVIPGTQTSPPTTWALYWRDVKTGVEGAITELHLPSGSPYNIRPTRYLGVNPVTGEVVFRQGRYEAQYPLNSNLPSLQDLHTDFLRGLRKVDGRPYDPTHPGKANYRLDGNGIARIQPGGTTGQLLGRGVAEHYTPTYWVYFDDYNLYGFNGTGISLKSVNLNWDHNGTPNLPIYHSGITLPVSDLPLACWTSSISRKPLNTLYGYYREDGSLWLESPLAFEEDGTLIFADGDLGRVVRIEKTFTTASLWWMPTTLKAAIHRWPTGTGYPPEPTYRDTWTPNLKIYRNPMTGVISFREGMADAPINDTLRFDAAPDDLPAPSPDVLEWNLLSGGHTELRVSWLAGIPVFRAYCEEASSDPLFVDWPALMDHAWLDPRLMASYSSPDDPEEDRYYRWTGYRPYAQIPWKQLSGMAIDSLGRHLYVADRGLGTITRIDLANKRGEIVAGRDRMCAHRYPMYRTGTALEGKWIGEDHPTHDVEGKDWQGEQLPESDVDAQTTFLQPSELRWCGVRQLLYFRDGAILRSFDPATGTLARIMGKTSHEIDPAAVPDSDPPGSGRLADLITRSPALPGGIWNPDGIGDYAPDPADGTLLISDPRRAVIYRYDPRTGSHTVVAGAPQGWTPTPSDSDADFVPIPPLFDPYHPGNVPFVLQPGQAEIQATNVKLRRPGAVRPTIDGGFWFVDEGLHRVYAVNPSGEIRVVAGCGWLSDRHPRYYPAIPPYPIQPIPGLVIPGNVDLDTRPILVNPDGSYSTVNSITIEEDGLFVLILGMDDSHLLTGEEARAQYQATGLHLGKFNNNADCETYANWLHEQYVIKDDTWAAPVQLHPFCHEWGIGAGLRFLDPVIDPKLPVPLHADLASMPTGDTKILHRSKIIGRRRVWDDNFSLVNSGSRQPVPYYRSLTEECDWEGPAAYWQQLGITWGLEWGRSELYGLWKTPLLNSGTLRDWSTRKWFLDNRGIAQRPYQWEILVKTDPDDDTTWHYLIRAIPAVDGTGNHLTLDEAIAQFTTGGGRYWESWTAPYGTETDALDAQYRARSAAKGWIDYYFTHAGTNRYPGYGLATNFLRVCRQWLDRMDDGIWPHGFHPGDYRPYGFRAFSPLLRAWIYAEADELHCLFLGTQTSGAPPQEGPGGGNRVSQVIDRTGLHHIAWDAEDDTGTLTVYLATIPLGGDLAGITPLTIGTGSDPSIILAQDGELRLAYSDEAGLLVRRSSRDGGRSWS